MLSSKNYKKRSLQKPAEPPTVIVIVGPTASGKSALAVALAKKHDGEVISADSRQVYKGLDLGSGKITQREMRGIRHHLIDVASPRRIFTASDFKRLSDRALKDIMRRKKTPIIAGGTAFYINALISQEPLPEVKPDPKLRARLEKKSTANLFAELQKRDPRRAADIDRHNRRRLVRALEIVLQTGKPVAPRGAVTSPFHLVKIGITLSKEELKKRIHERLRSRIRKGMIKEVEGLHANGLSWQRLDDLGLEYRFVSRYLRNMISRQEMIESIEKESWQYAKRQMTWWKKDKDIKWIKPTRASKAL